MNQFKSQTKFDINDIIKILPHRYPFILIDRIEITENAYTFRFCKYTHTHTHISVSMNTGSVVDVQKKIVVGDHLSFYKQEFQRR